MKAVTITARVLLLTGLIVLAGTALILRDGGTGYTFATGTFNLKIDSKASWNGVLQPSSTWALKNLVPGTDKFFNLDDVKPGDTGEATISLHVNKDSWICLNFQNLQSKENNINEPESHEDGDLTGELADGMEFFAWHDDGDNIFEKGEKPIFGTSTPQKASITLNGKTYAIADFKTGDPIKANKTKYIGLFWCAGNLTVDVPNAILTCDGTVLGNEAQTDSMSVDITFHAVPKDSRSYFRCGSGGSGEDIGLYVKCDLLASQGWPLPDYATECPDGFKIEEHEPSLRQDLIDTRTDRDTRDTSSRTNRTR